MKLDHIIETINTSGTIRNQKFEQFRFNVMNGKIKISQEFISRHNLVTGYGLDYGIVQEDGVKRLVMVKVPLTVKKNGKTEFVNPIPHICGSQKLLSKDGTFKGSVSRPDVVENVRQALVSEEQNVFSFDVNLTNPRVVPYVECLNHNTRSALVKRYNVEVFDMVVVNIDRV